ncbi:helix-turn-helix domain-containing protein [Actinosynnema sp. ALI-1.44]|uniref:helix-turn-helix domain-containing protein n=1 Tax=Actinosynnema sp. ALI-1.44 TaxID=1933779 RepID=UPI000A05BA41|nr:helix-turn-helix transcriptional regulator [Actinosynnema sp. ALI-1.44]
MDIEETHIGRRVRELRGWRGLSLTALAELSGMSVGHLSRIETGERPVTKRKTLESLAHALRVSPVELTGSPHPVARSKGHEDVSQLGIGVELGDGAQVAEIARDVHIDAIPSPARQAVFHANVGRALLSEKRTRDKGLATLLKAEKLAPQHIRGDVFVREAVSGELLRARRDAGGRELRGLAHRMGISPNG